VRSSSPPASADPGRLSRAPGGRRTGTPRVGEGDALPLVLDLVRQELDGSFVSLRQRPRRSIGLPHADLDGQPAQRLLLPVGPADQVPLKAVPAVRIRSMRPKLPWANRAIGRWRPFGSRNTGAMCSRRRTRTSSTSASTRLLRTGSGRCRTAARTRSSRPGARSPDLNSAKLRRRRRPQCGSGNFSLQAPSGSSPRPFGHRLWLATSPQVGSHAVEQPSCLLTGHP
jgi:hypothetical protein